MASNSAALSRRAECRRPSGALYVGLSIAITAALLPAIALAEGADVEAEQLAQQAIFDDYLRLDFKKAARKLRRALGLCKKAGCSSTIEAQILRDLAVVYVTGQNRKTKGKELLVKALGLDARIALDSDFTTPELVTVFSQAQRIAQKKRAKLSPAGSKQQPTGLDESLPGENMTGSEDCPPDFPGCASREKADDSEDISHAIDADEWSAEQWLTVSVQQDLLMLGNESGVCLANAPNELSCYRAGGTYRSPDNTAGNGGTVDGGFQVATTRVLVGYQRQMFLPELRLGALVGYALSGGPSEPDGADFLPYHAEINGQYSLQQFGPAITPFVSVSVGVAQVDASVITEVVDQNPNPVAGDALLIRSRVTVWKKTGTTFASLGGGARYPLGENGAITALGQFMYLFPSSGGSLSLQLGYAHRF